MSTPLPGHRRRALVAVIAIGLGLAAAPVFFQMFTRAPGGGDMITSFRAYMTEARIDQFQGYLGEISAAQRETATNDVTSGNRYPAVAEFKRKWPGINSDMTAMLTTMRANIDNYNGVAALPPFWLFPFFFVLPGLLVAGAATWTLVADRRDAPVGRRLAVLSGLGLAIVAAPLVFQMFTRAPGGAEMIDAFRPLMTDTKVTKVQGYFLVIGSAEGQFRTELSHQTAALPAVGQLSRDWPHISAEMAPMIGTMADNLDNFNGVAALPPFWLFPWFFVVPGLLIAGLAEAARRRTKVRPATENLTAASPPSPTPIERSLT
ncbi:MAG: hypothetical protein M3159_08340 [Actinomycetota bacterium]|nr:hypothetical protein [Actinomycetota bacterium]